jgi:CBS domain-containing protein
MKTIARTTHRPRMSLAADTAADLMSANPISLECNATVHEAIMLMTDRNFDAAPVIDEKGRPIGVVTVTDILVHDREYARYLKTGDMTVRSDAVVHSKLPADFEIEIVDRTSVREIMTPAIFTVKAETPAPEVVRKMLELKVHHLFVADRDGVLVGVISACDIIRCLEC